MDALLLLADGTQVANQAIRSGEVNDFSRVVIEYLFNSYPMYGILLIMMLLDVVTGTIAAVVKKQLSSKIGWRGMCKKAMTLLIIGMACALDVLQTTLPLAKITASFFIFNEALSILENAKRAGLPLPIFLVNAIEDASAKHNAGIMPDNGGHIELTVTNAKMTADVASTKVADVTPVPPPKDNPAG